jgi:murein DD-endopeptidase MepM/ murein hydrolase activator NlpD
MATRRRRIAPGSRVARLLALLVLLAFVPLASGPPAGAAVGPFSPPVDAPVVDPFRPPASPYGAGNRGWEYATEPGTTARAAGAGTVSFAGQVGGSLHVTVAHGGGLRTSYSFLATVGVRTGEEVERGSPLGATGELFHFGVRVGDRYIDPAALFRVGGLRERARLLTRPGPLAGPG